MPSFNTVATGYSNYENALGELYSPSNSGKAYTPLGKEVAVSATRTLPDESSEISMDATITSKGQITIPVAIRRRLRAKAGDTVTFKATTDGVTIARRGDENVFDKYRGAWGDFLPAGYEGIDGINRYVREIRGHDLDDNLFGRED